MLMIVIALLSDSKNFFLAGLAPLFPTFALVAHYTIGTQRTNADLKTTLIFSMLGIVPYFIYLLSTYILIDKLSLKLALFCATLFWIASAYILLLAWGQVK